MSNRIAITGLACRFPDAASPGELWKNVLAQRRAFRRFPRERLDLESYGSSDRSAADHTYVTRGAFLEDYHFDRVKFKISGDIYRAADPVHWLALEVAAGALADAGFAGGTGLPREVTGVFVGNTLTGEFSRANILRQRWPYAERVIANVLASEGWTADDVAALLQKIEPEFKRPFAVPGSESLAGGLSNTIAGRICNYFDLKGGGYAVDGACCSSLLAIISACSALTAGDIDVALAGGVDVSMDPFELVGFARVGALAEDSMRVFDRNATGFLPGEGCGFAVLMRYEEAVAMDCPVYGVVRGWGVSSDGMGGMTRPEIEGQRLVLARAYKRTGFDISDVGYFEGHGTGTEVGDAVELKALLAERRSCGSSRPAAVGSIKANIGHTKAAAGIAGFLKATLAVSHGVLPPTTGCETPHAELSGSNPVLTVLNAPAAWEGDSPRRAGVSSFGFGGINAHVVVEQKDAQARSPRLETLALNEFFTPGQELFLFAADGVPQLLQEVHTAWERAEELSRAEMADMAGALRNKNGTGVRAAIVASTPDELQARLQTLKSLLEGGTSGYTDSTRSIFIGQPHATHKPRIGFLFPGQASPVRENAGALARYFSAVESIYHDGTLPKGASTNTAVAQPSIIASSLAGLAALQELSIQADLALGHSIGEIAALCWAGAVTPQTALAIATERGRLMDDTPPGAMASLGASLAEAVQICEACSVELAAFNSPQQTVVSGALEDVESAVAMARSNGWPSVRLPVSHAFHSRYMAGASERLAPLLRAKQITLPQRTFFSSVSGDRISLDDNIRDLLVRQLTTPVQFYQAFSRAQATGVDLWIEVAAGAVLTGLVRECSAVPVVSLDVGSASERGLLNAAAAAYVRGVSVDTGRLFRRYLKPFDLHRRKTFLSNPCETAPGHGALYKQAKERRPVATPAKPVAVQTAISDAANDLLTIAVPKIDIPPIDIIRELVACATELPVSDVRYSDKLLDDLRLNSIVVAELAAKAAQQLGRTPLASPTQYANASLEQLAAALAQQAAKETAETAPPRGLCGWVRCFSSEWERMPDAPLGAFSKAPGTQSSDFISSNSKPPDFKSASKWGLHVQEAHPLRAALIEAFANRGEGTAFCALPGDEGESASILVELLRNVPQGGRFVLVHHGAPYSAFLRSVHAERPDLTMSMICIPVQEEFCAAAYREAISAHGLQEVRYQADGYRDEPVIRMQPTSQDNALPLLDGEVILCSGGAKGIGAECALALARESKARLLLVGRSSLTADAEASQNALRLSAAGVPFVYLQCDILDRSALCRLMGEAQASFGKVTAILHAAGHNIPAAFASLTEARIAGTVDPKVKGLENLLAAVDNQSLRFCISFGSIIGRIGMHGNADYALANELLRRRMEQLSAEAPQCRFLTVEWSLWSGVGMAHRLGSVESFAQRGLSAISPDEGTRILCSLLSTPQLPASVVVTGAFTHLPGLRLAGANPPLMRFLERLVKFIPEVELIAECMLNADTDSYLLDHEMNQTMLFPAVLGIEAMAQAAVALGLDRRAMKVTRLRLEQAITVSPSQPPLLRIYAYKETNGSIHVSLRSQTTGFQVDHFRAVLTGGEDTVRPLAPVVIEPAPVAPHSPADVYDTVLFQKGRFRRIAAYERLTSTSCRVRLVSNRQTWFGAYMPAELVLGDPGVRDAAMHAIQACVPTHTIVPVAVEEIVLLRQQVESSELLMQACERSHAGNTFVYDIDLCLTDGTIIEQWRDVVLRQVEPIAHARFLSSRLLVEPYLQRRTAELFSARDISAWVSVACDPAPSRSTPLLRSLAEDHALSRRSDGKPEIFVPQGHPNRSYVSATHTAGLAIGFRSTIPVGCDAEVVQFREEEVWAVLLGAERFNYCRYLAASAREDMQTVATRLWCMHEALIKSGFNQPVLPRLIEQHPEGWMELACGRAIVLSWCAEIAGQQIAVAFAAIENTLPSYVPRMPAGSLKQ